MEWPISGFRKAVAKPGSASKRHLESLYYRYERLMPTVYDRRLEQEWRLLGLLASINPSVIEVVSRTGGGHDQAFVISLRKTTGLVAVHGDLTEIGDHEATFHFPRFFPTPPIEASLRTSVFHPNVHPETGFVCLWGRFSVGDT